MLSSIFVTSPDNSRVLSHSTGSLPANSAAGAVLARSGNNALLAAEEFFRARINNPHTRRAYSRSINRFLTWCSERGLELHQISPGMAGEYMETMEGSAPTRNQALAGLRHFFDTLVTRHVVGLNPFSSVRGIRHKVQEGRTPEIQIEQARALLRSIDVSDPVGLRDRAVLGVLAYTGARIGAVAGLRMGDLQDLGGGDWALRFTEKGGRQREIPVRHDLKGWLQEYIDAAGIADATKADPLFRASSLASLASSISTKLEEEKRNRFNDSALTAHSMRQMLKRRLKSAGLSDLFSPHSFRVAVVTDLLSQNIPLEDVQYLAGHADPRTTQLYDRRHRQVTRNIVERISI